MSRKSIAFSISCVVTLGCLQAAQQQLSPAVGPNAPTAASQRALLDKYCVTCHSDKLKTGGLSLQSADIGKAPEEAELWEKVIRKVRGGAMPPQGMPRPDKAAFDGFASWLEASIDHAAAAKP